MKFVNSRYGGYTKIKMASYPPGNALLISALQREVEELTARLEYEESEERLNRIRGQLQKEIKAGVEEEVLSELHSHETVSYISSLELSVKR